MADRILSDIEGSGIYQIRNLINGKRYIGSARCFRIRWNSHRTYLRKGQHHSRHLQASWRKHGQESFVFEILELCHAESLIRREQAWLDRERPEFNICPTAGSTFGRYHSSETRAKIADRAMGRKAPPRSPEYRRKISARFKGKQKSAEHMAALQAGRSRQIYTEERRAKVGESLRQAYLSGLRPREKSEEHKNKIGQFYAKLTDDEVREIRSLRKQGITGRELAKRYKSNPGTISGICSGKRYRWVA